MHMHIPRQYKIHIYDLQKKKRVARHDPKPFKCNHEGCNFSFTRNEHLVRHTRTHTGEKPFLCPYPNCEKRFSRVDNLSQHIKSHETKIKKMEEKNKSVSEGGHSQSLMLQHPFLSSPHLVQDDNQQSSNANTRLAFGMRPFERHIPVPILPSRFGTENYNNNSNNNSNNYTSNVNFGQVDSVLLNSPCEQFPLSPISPNVYIPRRLSYTIEPSLSQANFESLTQLDCHMLRQFKVGL